MKSREGFIPGLVPDQQSSTPDIQYVPANASLKVAPMTKSAKKNAKRREKKKQQANEGDKSIIQQVNQLTVTDQSSSSMQTAAEKPSQSQPSSQLTPSADSKAEIVKRLRNLRKKLKQIDDLKARIDSGDLEHPEKEQLEKINKRQIIVDELEDLELELDD